MFDINGAIFGNTLFSAPISYPNETWPPPKARDHVNEVSTKNKPSGNGKIGTWKKERSQAMDMQVDSSSGLLSVGQKRGHGDHRPLDTEPSPTHKGIKTLATNAKSLKPMVKAVDQPHWTQ